MEFRVRIIHHASSMEKWRQRSADSASRFETSNPIFGATCNPHDRTRGSGGSSGGESALIAAGASVLGFGSDLGGSIRNPCAFTGLCGFKPTAERCRQVENNALVDFPH